MTKKIWGDYNINPLVERYTKGTDNIVDGKLLAYDIHATKAHINMLMAIEILTKKECNKLVEELDLLAQDLPQSFAIPEDFEDGHSFLESYLIEKTGNIAKKVHFLRSRNDQSLVMLRLYMKDQLEIISQLIHILESSLSHAAKENSRYDMPGYTHMQKAMPTSVGEWLDSYAQALQDVSGFLIPLRKMVDQNPLGSGSGFGFKGQAIVPERQLTTDYLGFAQTQANPIYCGLSRGFFEMQMLQVLEPVMILASQFAADMLLFTTSEYDYFSLPPDFLTGSSIMPQKHNYDLFEIMRGNGGLYTGHVAQIKSVISKKTSGYQRDLQLTKKPFIEGLELLTSTINVWTDSVDVIVVNKQKLDAAMSPDLYLTQKANDLVASGLPFRDAYLKVKKEYEEQ